MNSINDFFENGKHNSIEKRKSQSADMDCSNISNKKILIRKIIVNVVPLISPPIKKSCLSPADSAQAL